MTDSQFVKFLTRMGINDDSVQTIGGKLVGLGAALNSKLAGGYHNPNVIDGYSYNPADYN